MRSISLNSSDGKILPMHLRLDLLKIIGVPSKWSKVYEGNWSAKTRHHLIRRIKIKQKKID